MKTIGEWKKLFIENVKTLTEESAPTIEDEATFMQGIDAMISDLKRINPEAAERYRKFALDAWKSGKLKSREDLEDQIEDDEVPSPDEIADAQPVDPEKEDLEKVTKEFIQSYGVEEFQKELEKFFSDKVKVAGQRGANKVGGFDPDVAGFLGAGTQKFSEFERKYKRGADAITNEIEKIINKVLAVNENKQLVPYANLLIKEVNRIYGLRTNK